MFSVFFLHETKISTNKPDTIAKHALDKNLRQKSSFAFKLNYWYIYTHSLSLLSAGNLIKKKEVKDQIKQLGGKREALQRCKNKWF